MLFKVDSDCPTVQPLVLELLIFSGGVSVTPVILCKIKTSPTSEFPLIDESPVVDTLFAKLSST